MAVYELGLLGEISRVDREIITATISQMVSEFGLSIGAEVVLHDSSTVLERDPHVAFAAAYFGGVRHLDELPARVLGAASVPVIPTIAHDEDFTTHIPESLKGFNGLRRQLTDRSFTELSVAMLECVGLLRRQRRIFVSYRRVESRQAAMQLHDLLTECGFDVFLDTHAIRPGEPFQSVLWQRLCDSDVMVMLDTPTYFESKWTRQEIGRARAKEIHVLRVVWPGYQPNKLLDLAETIYLERSELVEKDGPIIDRTAADIVLAVERLRSRSIASRYMSITGRLRAEVTRIGAAVEGVGAHRAIAVRLLNGTRIWAYPVVGVPNAELLNDVAEKAKHAEHLGTPVLVYDHLGIGERWSAHLKWLDDNIGSVRALKVFEAGWTLAAWGE